MRNHPAPLKLTRITDPDYSAPRPRTIGSPIIESTWSRIAANLASHDRRRNEFHSELVCARDLANMRSAFAAGVYAASAALNMEDATSMELSEAAERVERGECTKNAPSAAANTHTERSAG